MNKLSLQNVTVCAASDVALEATLASLERCLDQVNFGDAVIFTSLPLPRPPRPGIRQVDIPSLSDREHYGRFILSELTRHVNTDFVLIVQWDGFVIEPQAWLPSFLDYDYVGAPWVDQAVHSVGNGGFSLRSKRLLAAGNKPWFEISHPEDLCVCRENRAQMEVHGFRFAPVELARRFSIERGDAVYPHFGAHGIFRLAELMDKVTFSAFLDTIEYGVIGKTELIDVAIIFRRLHGGRSRVERRCAWELFRRFPFDRKAIWMVMNILKWQISA